MKTILFLLGMAWAVHSPLPKPLQAARVWRPHRCIGTPFMTAPRMQRSSGTEPRNAGDALHQPARRCRWREGREVGARYRHRHHLHARRRIDLDLPRHRNGAWNLRPTADATPSGRPKWWTSAGRYHAFISYVRGVPETWKGTRDILHYTSTNLLDWKFEKYRGARQY